MYGFFMSLLCADEELWRKMCLATRSFVAQGDVRLFVEAVASLLGVSVSMSGASVALALNRPSNSHSRLKSTRCVLRSG